MPFLFYYVGRRLLMMKKGLVLEGGAMRGLFTAGVIDVMLENGIEYDGGIGVSAGAAFGCNYKSKQIGRPLRYNTTYAKDPRYCSFRSLLFTGDLYGAKFCYDTLPKKLDVMDEETYRANPMKFYIVATDVETGEAVYKELEDLSDEDMAYMRASASMPVVSRPVKIGGHEYLDGGISDSIPLKKFEEMGYEKNVVDKALQKRHEVYNETLDYIEERRKQGAAYVIAPPQALKIGRIEHDPEVMRNVYYLGRREGLRHLAAVKEFLQENEENHE